MLSFSPTKDPKEFAVILGSSYYENKRYIGQNFVHPLGAKVSNFGKKLISIGAYENTDGKKPTVKQLKPHIEELLEYLDTEGIDKVICVNAPYFAYLTGQKFEASVGTLKPVKFDDYSHIQVCPIPNPVIVNKHPMKKPLVDLGIQTAIAMCNGEYSEVGFEFEEYQEFTQPEQLQTLLKHPVLAWDIETTGLRFESDKILTIAFSWGTHSAATMCIHEHYHSEEQESLWLKALKDFFTQYTGKLVAHNVLFDSKFIVRHCFMSDSLDMKGAYLGAKYVYRDEDDTMIMKYLCENSTARPSLGLKEATKFFLGDYAESGIKEAIKIPRDDLLEYNGKDTCGTFWLFEKLSQEIIKEEQVETYEEIFKPSLEYLTLMMLTGLPLDADKVTEAYDKVNSVVVEASETLSNNWYVKDTEAEIREQLAQKYNESHVSQKKAEDFQNSCFNPNSIPQKKLLLIDIMEYPVLDTTESGAPSLSRSVLEDYLKGEEDTDKKEVLEALISLSQASIVLNTFIKTFDELKHPVGDGNFRLHGNISMAKVASGRLNSSSPNMQNIPSGSHHAKTVKSCFVAPKGTLFFGSDYASLEARVGGCIAHDSALIRAYNDGIDLHSLNAYAYFKDQMPDIDPNNLESLNSIARKYPGLRQKSKAPTFAL